MTSVVRVRVPPPARNKRCCNPGPKKRVLGYDIAFVIGRGVLFCPGDCLFFRGFVEDRGEGFCRVGGDLAAFVEVDAGEERLVREALVRLVAAFVDLREIARKVEGSIDECSGSLVVVVVLGDLCFDAVEFCLESHLESLELLKAERVGEVCFEELVLLGEDLLAPFG